LTLGYVDFDFTNTVSHEGAVSTQKAAQAAGWTFILQDAKGDAAQANTICTQYVTRHVSAVIVSVFDISQMSQCMTAAGASKIPVFYIGPLSNGMAGAISPILPSGVDNAVVADLKALGNQTKVQLLQLDYTAGPPCRVRQDTLSHDLSVAGLNVSTTKDEVSIPGQVTSGQALTQAWLSAHPAAAGEKLVIWACWSEPALGAIAAIKQAGRTGEKIPIYTFEWTSPVEEAIKSNEIAATSYFDPNITGGLFVTMIKNYLAGGKPQEIDYPNQVVTPGNIVQFLAQHPGANG
jgi:ribose transport system substrate-binding protein